jgi:hypothetical protein
VVNDVSRTELGKGKKPGAADEFTIVERDKCSRRQTGEVISGEKSLAGKVSIRIEV